MSSPTGVVRTSKLCFIKKIISQLTRRFIVRDFHYEDSALEKQRKELSELEAEEKELWVGRCAPSITLTDKLTRT